jgi:hypothetical protein
MKVGTDAAMEIWRDALQGLKMPPTIPDLAAATTRVAERRLGPSGAAAAKDAWRAVGVS